MQLTDLTVHHLEQSRSHRVLWMLEELGLQYDMTLYRRDPKTMRAPADLKAVFPLGRAPVVTIGDTVTLAESGAILEFFADHTGRLRPEPGTPAFQQYRFFMHYAEGSLMPPLLVALITGKLRSGPLPFFIKPIAKTIANKIDGSFTHGEFKTHFGFVEQTLSEQPYFAGDAFSAADIQMSYPVFAGLERARLGDVPNLRDWWARMNERPAFKRAEARGGPIASPA